MGNTFARWYDVFMSPLEKGRFRSVRKSLAKKADGLVLEIGSGTGINFPYYESAEQVIAIEPSRHMMNRSEERKRKSAVPIQVIQESAEQLPFADSTFDTVVATLVFCTIPHPERALREIKRVCKPGGRILVFEHVRMENPFLAKWQDWLPPYWKKVCDGCCLNRDTVHMMIESGLKVVSKQSLYKGLFVQMDVRNEGA